MSLLLSSALLPQLIALIAVHAPVEPDDYPVFYFVNGFGGVNPPPFYDDVLSNISSHG